MYTDGRYTDRALMERFPYHGVFYVLASIINSDDGSYDLSEDDDDIIGDDGSYDLSEDDEDEVDTSSDDTSSDDTSDGEEETDAESDDSTDDDTSSDSSEEVIFETPCDIQQANALFSGAITRGYRIYFPFDPRTATLPSELKPGILFRGEMHGLTIAGTVLDPVASMLGGCVVEIRGTDI